MSLSASIFFGFHDSSVTVANSTEVLLHFEAERYFRKKHHLIQDVREAEALLGAALSWLGADIGSVERVYVARCGNPLSAGTITLLGRDFDYTATAHHANHIGSVLNHGFDDALIVVADGGSEDGTTKIYYQAADGTIRFVHDLDRTPATGKFYAGLTMLVINPDFLASHAWDAGKTMGLSAYGRYAPAFESLMDQIPGLHPELQLDVAKARALFGLSDDYRTPWLDARRRDLARTGQDYFVDYFLRLLAPHRHLSENLVLVGGCALNVLLNSALAGSGLFKNLYIGPVSGDCGQSLGAIMYHERGGTYNSPFLGRGFG